MKEEVSIRLISHITDLPDIASNNFFHSKDFFRILEATPMQEPCMAVAENSHGHIIAHMLTIIFFHRSILPPAIYSHGRVYGEGEYETTINNVDKEYIFGRFLEAVTSRFSHHLCFYIEFSSLSKKMFGYETFKKNGYFPIQWQEIHNSLHSVHPEERVSEKIRQRIIESSNKGVTSRLVKNDGEELRQSVNLLRSFFRFKMRRSIPSTEMFKQLVYSDVGRLIVTKYKKRVIGTCLCIFTHNNAYIWYMASLRKTYLAYHPATYTIWSALKLANIEGMRHMYFLDAGLPFKHSSLRDFILRFGGKPVSTYRWFRTPITWLNKALDWIYNE